MTRCKRSLFTPDSQMTRTGRPNRSKTVLAALLKYGVPLVITVGLCTLLFRGMDLREMWRTMRAECDFRWMWGNLAFTILAMASRAARWRIQLRGLGINSPFGELLLSIFGTYSVNLVLPRLGEVWRSGFIARRRNAPFTRVFGSMVADRLADTVCVALITLVTFLFAGSQLRSYLEQDPDMGRGIIDFLTSPLLWGAVAAVAAAGVFLLLRYPDHPAVVRLKQIWKGLWEGFAVIAHMRGKGLWCLYTVAIWACYIISLWFAFRSFPLTARAIDLYGPLALLVCFVLSSIAMGVPSNGGIGPYQWALIFGLTFYSAGIPGLDYNYCATFANMIMGTQTLFLILLGIFTFTRIALSRKSK